MSGLEPASAGAERVGGCWTEWIAEQAAGIRAAGQWRAPRSFDAAGPTGRLGGTGTEPSARGDVNPNTGTETKSGTGPGPGPGPGPGLDVVSFASNDYLGLSQHPAVKAAAVAAVERWGTGAGASRLVVGSRPVHHDLEAALAEWRGAEAAVVFPTGYAANLGLLATLGGPGVRVHSDALNHASIIDGCRLARANGADVRVHPHADRDALAAALARPGADRQVVVTDSVFSMDGDVAPVDELVALCARHGALLVLDEAHSVLQPVSPRPAEDQGTIVQVGTLSKTLGALGGFVAGPQAVVDLLVNRARPYIFTTALSPADAAAALAAVAIVTSGEGDELRTRLRDHVEHLRPGHPSPILAVILGDEAAALAAASTLLDQGLLVPAIRPPTVPVGTSRLRVALSAAHTAGQVERLARALAALTTATSDEAPGAISR